MTSATVTIVGVQGPPGPPGAPGTEAPLSSSTPAAQSVGDAGTAGTIDEAARIDHRHPMPGEATFDTPGFMSVADRVQIYAPIRSTEAWIMGDSIGNRNLVESSIYSNLAAEGMFNWANWLLGAPCDFRVIAVSGATYADVMAVQYPLLVAANPRPGKVYLSLGTNDLYASGKSGAQTAADIISLVDAIRGLGVETVFGTVLARSYESDAVLREHLICNDLLRQAALSNERYAFFDGFAATVDYASPTPTALAGLWSDVEPMRLHPNNVGAALLGSVIADAERRLHGFAAAGLTNNWAEDTVWSSGANLIQNKLFSGAGGTVGAGITGPVPTEWEVSRAAGSPSGVVSIVDVAHPVTGLAMGKGIKVVMTALAAGDEIRITQDTGIHPYLIGGDSIQGEGRFMLSDPVGVSRLTSRVQSSTGQTHNAWCGYNEFTSGNFLSGFDVTHRTRPLRLTPDLAVALNARWEVKVLFSGPGSCALTAWAPRYRKTSA